MALSRPPILTLTWTLMLASSLLRASELGVERLDNWHQWRGPDANGLAPKGDPPLRWDESTNIRWKVKVPGSGVSTPIVWGDRIFLLTAIKTDRKPDPDAPSAARETPRRDTRRGRGRRGGFRLSTETPTTFHKFSILCIDRKSGKTLWDRVATEQVPHEGHHPSHGYASASPTTDGTYLYSSFGSYGVTCHDLEGNLKWKRDLGDMQTKLGFGEGTSPVLHGDSLVVNWDHEGDSFITCLNTESVEPKWRVSRDEGSTWATPLVVAHDGITQVITNAKNRTRSYDLTTGKLVWECGGQESNPIPSPIVRDGIVYCMTGFRGYALYAIPLAARGDLTDNGKVAWRRNDGAPYVASPLIYGNFLYFTKERRGILSCVDATTGKDVYSDQRLSGISTLYASLTGAAGRVYITGRGGTTLVIKRGPKYEVLAINSLDEGVDASLAIVGKQLFLRGKKHLYCIARD